jgi:transcriptional regulator with XRE-family HTH domain
MEPKHLTKQQFGQRLYSLMLQRNWNQSDLARHAGIPRDAISTYIRGKFLPTARNLDKLAKAFGLQKVDILPNYVEGSMEAEEHPEIELRASASAPGMCWLRINRLVSMATAVKIIELIETDSVGAKAANSD